MNKEAEPLTLMPPSGPLSIRSRYVYMTEIDWRAFSEALVEAFPDARYRVSKNGPRIVTSDQPPKVLYHRDLFSAGGWLYDATEMILDPTWEPQFAKYRPFPEKPEELWWIILNHPRPSVRFRVGKPETAEELKGRQRMGNDQIDFYSHPNDKAQTALRNRFHRILGKFTTNKHQVWYSFPGYEPLRTDEKGSQFWIGHDAIRWAREDKQRLFFYSDRKAGFRPKD